MTTEPDPDVPGAKARWRRRLLAARRLRSAAETDSDRRAISAHLMAALAPLRDGPAQPTVCVYLPLPTEPLAPELPYSLVDAGFRVLAPVARPARPLDWCALPTPGVVHDGAAASPAHTLARGSLGVLEPTGPRLGAGAIRGANVVLVPALAVDDAGFRLGRGGGFYDRSLAMCARAGLPNEGSLPPVAAHSRSGRGAIPVAPGAPVAIAVVFDDEAGLPIPHDDLDRPVTHVVTPRAGLTRLG